MRKGIPILAALAALTLLAACSEKDAAMRREAIRNIQHPETLAEVQAFAQGEWRSLSIELRPTEDRTGSGAIASTYVTRNFTYLNAEKFTGIITLYGDGQGEAPLMAFEFKGDLQWGEPHPIAAGAWEINYVLSDGFAVTPLSPEAAAMLNQVPVEGIAPFEVGKKTDILKKAFPLFNIREGQVVVDYDLIYFRNGMLFMGAKHVDGTPFDRPENRPGQLQVPLARQSMDADLVYGLASN